MSYPLISIALPGFPPLPNQTRRQHFHARSDEAATWRQAAKLVALQALRDTPYPQDFPLRGATIELVVIGVKADPDACVAAIKPCLDGIVDAGVLRDDSWRTLFSLTVRHEDGPRGHRFDVIYGRAA